MTRPIRTAPHPDPEGPSPGRAAVLLVGALASGAVLLVLPTAAPPAGVHDVLTWWTEAGTPEATMVLLRGLGLVMAASTAVLATLGFAVAVAPGRSTRRLWHRLAPTPIRRLLVASALVGSTLTATTAGAAEVDAPPILIDLGPDTSPAAVAPLPVLRDLGPVESAADTVATAATWTVAPGDHLWRIAADTVADRETDPSDARVATYWRQLIDANRQVIGDDADLIHPGQVLVLPD